MKVISITQNLVLGHILVNERNFLDLQSALNYVDLVSNKMQRNGMVAMKDGHNVMLVDTMLVMTLILKED